MFKFFEGNAKNGVIVVNKPAGMTSHDVVDYFRRKLNKKKIGHAGTLDPLATGVLIILVGDATKKQSEFMHQEKEYEATVILGATSDTDDAEGKITGYEIRNSYEYTKDRVEKILQRFIGEIKQVPPAYSAIKIKGKKAYELARKGMVLNLRPREIVIKNIELLDYKWPELKIKIVCGSGTYIRALARDIGKELECGGYLKELIRTRSGIFVLKDAVSI